MNFHLLSIQGWSSVVSVPGALNECTLLVISAMGTRHCFAPVNLPYSVTRREEGRAMSYWKIESSLAEEETSVAIFIASVLITTYKRSLIKVYYLPNFAGSDLYIAWALCSKLFHASKLFTVCCVLWPVPPNLVPEPQWSSVLLPHLVWDWWWPQCRNNQCLFWKAKI